MLQELDFWQTNFSFTESNIAMDVSQCAEEGHSLVKYHTELKNIYI